MPIPKLTYKVHCRTEIKKAVNRILRKYSDDTEAVKDFDFVRDAYKNDLVGGIIRALAFECAYNEDQNEDTKMLIDAMRQISVEGCLGIRIDIRG